MKKIFWTVFVLTSFVNVQGQKIAEDKVDEFTKHHVKRTSWDMLCRTSQVYAHSRLEKIDTVYWLNLKLMSGGGVIAMRDQAKVMLMTNTDSIITLLNSTYEISCRGCGSVGITGSDAQGLKLDFWISQKQMDFIIKSGVKKIRIYLTDGYVEGDVKDKFEKSFIKQLELITN